MFKKIISIVFVFVNAFIFAGCNYSQSKNNFSGGTTTETTTDNTAGSTSNNSSNTTSDTTNDTSSDTNPAESDFLDKKDADCYIYNVADFNNFLNNCNQNNNYYQGKTIKLMADIPETIYSTAERFSGTFDGNNYTINFSSSYSGYDKTHYGLFKKIDGISNEKATIKNLTIISTVNQQYNLDASEVFCGALAGECSYANIENVMVMNGTIQCGSTSGATIYMGGLVGFAVNSTFTKCYNSSELESRSVKEDDFRASCGGIVGYAYSTNISKCLNYGSIDCNIYPKNEYSYDYYDELSCNAVFGLKLAREAIAVGGICGRLFGGTVEYCQNFGAISSVNVRSANTSFYSTVVQNIGNCFIYPEDSQGDGVPVYYSPIKIYAIPLGHKCLGGGQFGGANSHFYSSRLYYNEILKPFGNCGGIVGFCEESVYFPIKICNNVNNFALNGKYIIKLAYKFKINHQKKGYCDALIEYDIHCYAPYYRYSIIGNSAGVDNSKVTATNNYISEIKPNKNSYKITKIVQHRFLNFYSVITNEAKDSRLFDSDKNLEVVAGGYSSGNPIRLSFTVEHKNWLGIVSDVHKKSGKDIRIGANTEGGSTIKFWLDVGTGSSVDRRTYATVNMKNLNNDGIDHLAGGGKYEYTKQNTIPGGFDTSIWFCDPTVNDGYPTLKWPYWQNASK